MKSYMGIQYKCQNRDDIKMIEDKDINKKIKSKIKIN